MTFVLGQRSIARLSGVHPALIAVIRRAIEISDVDFTVLEGVRSMERQKILFDGGASKTMNSRHLTGHAVDLGAYVGGEVRWEWALYQRIAKAVNAAADELAVDIVWGGDWDDDGSEADEKGLRDGPHFQLKRSKYP
jgi:peptidoglycan L-alanyl-D-glutamate endopeptidase CwlK